MDFTEKDVVIIQKMIKISKEKPLLPKEFIPWSYEDKGDEIYLSDNLISIAGLKEYDQLSAEQKRELGRRELGQVMYSYAWSETMACAFFNRRLLKIDVHNLEYKFLLRETIEEYRHQSMFCDAIERIGVTPFPPSRLHKWIAKLTVMFAPDSIMFLSVLGIELATDFYGDVLRRDKSIHPVIQKVSVLHHIEEERHILFAKKWLKKYTENAGFVRRTIYAIIVVLNLYFMRTMYVRKEIFDKMGLINTKALYKKARRNLAVKFGRLCLSEVNAYVDSFNGWNAISRYLAKVFLKINIPKNDIVHA